MRALPALRSYLDLGVGTGSRAGRLEPNLGLGRWRCSHFDQATDSGDDSSRIGTVGVFEHGSERDGNVGGGDADHGSEQTLAAVLHQAGGDLALTPPVLGPSSTITTRPVLHGPPIVA